MTYRIALFLVLLVHTQCVFAQDRRATDPSAAPGVAVPIEDEEVVDEEEADGGEEAPSQERTDVGTPPKSAPSGNTAEINVKNADIANVIRIFSRKTKRNYILDERVKGKVSIYLPGKVSADESLKILDSVLGLKGFTAVPLGENLWKVIPTKEAKQSTIPTVKDDSNRTGSGSVVTRIVSLKYVGADEAKEVIAQLVSPDGLASAYGGTNSLLIIDYEDNVERLVDILNTVDVPFSNREMTIIPVQHAEAEDIAKKLSEILGIGEEKDAKAGGGENALDLVRARMRETTMNNAAANQGNPVVGSSAGGEASGNAIRSHQPKIISDERTNSIIVVADDDTTARVRAIIAQLDSELDMSGFRYYVYRCQHANAEEIAEVLSGLVGGGVSSSSRSSGSNLLSSGSDSEGGALGLNTNSRNRGNRAQNTQSRLSGQSRTPGRSRSENSSGSSGPSSVQLGENVSITADKATNSLVINAGKADYEKIKELLKQLDIKRRQVLVEAMILEVGVDETAEFGTDFMSSGGGADGGVLAKSDFGAAEQSLTTLFSDPSKISKFSIAAASAGTLKLPGGIEIPTQSVLLTAAQANTNVNVLSSPNLLTTDNEEAEIVVGQNVPFLASQSTSDSNLNNTFNQIDRQDVGITLRLTPQISSQSFVTMNIFTEVSSVINQTELGPTTAIRTSETTVIAKDGQMVVIGGLLADTSNTSDSGVPFLKDIPVLGSIFRSSNEERRKTNLLIFITPRIVQDQFDHREVTIDHRNSLEGEIFNNNVFPDRNKELRNPDIDKVTEAQMYEGEKPSTILPPAPPTTEQGAALVEPSSVEPSVSRKLSTDSPGVIQLKVAPKLPTPQSSDSPRSMLKSSALQSRFYLLEASKDAEVQNAPFAPSSESRVFGIEIPDGSAPVALQFFKEGSGYTYSKGSSSIPLKVKGAYQTRQDAQSALGQGTISWYTLSPYEVMSLGTDLWLPQ